MKSLPRPRRFEMTPPAPGIRRMARAGIVLAVVLALVAPPASAHAAHVFAQAVVAAGETTAAATVLEIVIWRVEASPGIEPGCKDLQSSA